MNVKTAMNGSSLKTATVVSTVVMGLLSARPFKTTLVVAREKKISWLVPKVDNDNFEISLDLPYEMVGFHTGILCTAFIGHPL